MISTCGMPVGPSNTSIFSGASSRTGASGARMTKSTRRCIGRSIRSRVSRPWSPPSHRLRSQKIALLTPGGQFTESWFTNGGTEANETDILSARCFTGNTEIVSLRHFYHGRTATGDDAYRGTWRARPAAGRHRACRIIMRTAIVAPCGLTYPSCEVKSSVAPPARASPDSSPNRSRAWRFHHAAPRILPDHRADRPHPWRRLHQHEVQTGWGRTGANWFGVQAFHVSGKRLYVSSPRRSERRRRSFSGQAWTWPHHSGAPWARGRKASYLGRFV